MVGLEKTKAKNGELSQSARALTSDDMRRLHDHCLAPGSGDPREITWGAMRYVSPQVLLYVVYLLTGLIQGSLSHRMASCFTN